MRIAVCFKNRTEQEKCCRLLAEAAKDISSDVSIDRYDNNESLLFKNEDRNRNYDLVFMDSGNEDEACLNTAKSLARNGSSPTVVFMKKGKGYEADIFVARLDYYKLENDSTQPGNIFRNIIEDNEQGNDEYIAVRSSGRKKLIPIKRIEYIESNNRILTVHYENRTLDFYSTIKQMEERLREKGFVRVQKSYLVAAREISSLTFEELELRSGKKLPVGKKYYENINELYEKQFIEHRCENKAL